MAIFQSSVLNKYLKQQDDTIVAKAYKKYIKYFHDATIQQNIKDSNEEQYQAKFLDELFVNILGYTLNPHPKFNLATEFKNAKNSKKADGAILLNDEALAVIELKGTNTKDLESIRQQAFDYKANQPGCVYVVTSNFEKLRFYINNAVDFEEFDLFNLSYNRFELLYLCLHKDHLLKNVPLKIKEASLHEEEAITKKFYGDYSNFKRELFRDIVKRNLRNPELRDLGEASSKKALFKKTQKLLDRFLFIFFGEDRGLLPPNSIPKILEQWKQLEKMDAYSPLYDRYKKYFTYLNEGWKGEDHEIFAYNGGLFKPDPILDTIEIDDQLLYKHTAILTKYDFESQVDVNILGHIFEHSLNEIESVNAEIEGVEFDKQKSKRKKDGVFYTPKYITKYIVDNTVGKLCEEKKAELEILEEEYLKGPKHRAKKTIKKLDEQIQAYRNWLLTLTICDPACGSGAFLNQALEFLIQEHRWIDEMTAKLFGGGLVFQDVENSILENNIYGVDLNDESVEIAKLSLWLRTAQKGRKLTSLNNNIKCGNSLIDSKAVAGDKAFKWEDEFPEVFAKGGFDVVIGNPPYVRVQTIKDSIEIESKELEKIYSSATKRYDLFVLFMEKSFHLVKSTGVVNFILPHKFLIADFGFDIRKFLRENRFIDQLISFGHEIVFETASTYTCIVQLKKNSDELKYVETTLKNLLDKQSFSKVALSELQDKKWELNDQSTKSLLDKINKQPNSLEKLLDGISQGIKNTSDKIFMLRGGFSNGIFKGFSDELGEEVEIEAEIMLPVAKGKDIKRFRPLNINYHVIYPHYFDGTKTMPYEEDEFRDKFPKAYDYLSLFKELLIEKKIRYKTNPKYWFSLHRSRELEIFLNDKIVTATIQNYPHFTIDHNKALTDAGGYALVIKPSTVLTKDQLLPILNSRLMWFFIKNTSSVYRGGYYAFNTTYLNPFPIPEENKIKSVNIDLLGNMNIQLNSKLTHVSSSFKKYFQSQYDLNIISNKLQSWHNLDFSDFIKELNKAIKKAGGEKLSKMDEMEWMELFETKKKEALELKGEIDRTDWEIDQLVYELYGLTDEEVKIVEGVN